MFLTKGAKMVATCLSMLYVAELILLTMGLRGALSLWILGRPNMHGMVSPVYNGGIVDYQKVPSLSNC